MSPPLHFCLSAFHLQPAFFSHTFAFVMSSHVPAVGLVVGLAVGLSGGGVGRSVGRGVGWGVGGKRQTPASPPPPLDLHLSFFHLQPSASDLHEFLFVLSEQSLAPSGLCHAQPALLQRFRESISPQGTSEQPVASDHSHMCAATHVAWMPWSEQGL